MERFYFEGVLDGSIGLREVGENNFGYDSIFDLEGFSKSQQKYQEVDRKEQDIT